MQASDATPGGFKKFFECVEGFLCLRILGFILIFSLGFITLEILSRIFFHHSFVGIVEVTEICVVLILYLSLPIVQSSRSHITVDLLPSKLKGRRAGAVLDCMILAGSIATVALLLWMQVWYCGNSYRMGTETSGLFLPTWPVVGTIAVGFFFYLIRLIIQFLQSFSVVVRPKEAKVKVLQP